MTSWFLVCGAAHADVPGRVGRIAFMEGDVQAYSETEPEWKVAYVNQPITSRNSVFVGDAGRAEISVGSTTLAMDAGSQVDIQQLDDNTLDANVVRGRVSVRVRRFDGNDAYHVAIPGADFALLKPGRYRVDALGATGGITVFAGEAGVQDDRGERLIEAGNALRVVGNATQPDAPPQLLAAAPVPVPLDDWVVARESRFRDGQAQRYVSPNMTGYEDLDANGRWATDADLGPVWYPSTYVRDDWAPYRYGRWAYVEPWGYTWVDDAPWGFAPFHYGRWVQVGPRWGWCPGAYVARPVYAPALVGFYGGSGFSASFSVGVGPAVGWYPLAPWQRYAPQYTRNASYVNQVNNITIVEAPQRFGGRDAGRDWNREHGATIAPQDAFASQRSISRVAIAAPRNFGDRGGVVTAAELPRPMTVPGAVRRGPEGLGNGGRPDFRSPREFASRPAEAGSRPFEQGGRPGAPAAAAPSTLQGPPQGNGRGLPPNYQRLEERRPVVNAETVRPPGAVETGGPATPTFNRDHRGPQAPVAPVTGGVPAREATTSERPNRENRNVQPPPQGVDRQPVEQPRPVEQQRQPVEQQQRQQADQQRQQGDTQRQQADQQRQQADAQRQQFEQQRQRQQGEQQQRQQNDVQRQQVEQQRQRQQVEQQQRQQGEQQRVQAEQQRQQGEQQRQRQQVETQQRQQAEAQRQAPQAGPPQGRPPQPAPQPAAPPARVEPKPFENRDR